MSSERGGILSDAPVLVADQSATDAGNKLLECSREGQTPERVHRNGKGQIDQVDLPGGHCRKPEYDNDGQIKNIIGASWIKVHGVETRIDLEKEGPSKDGSSTWYMYTEPDARGIKGYDGNLRGISKCEIDKQGNIKLNFGDNKSLNLQNDGTMVKSQVIKGLEEIYDNQ